MRALAALLLLLCAATPASAQADPIHDAVDAYALYQGDVSALLSADVSSPEALNAALERAARHDPRRVARGWIAYGALAAAQSPAFVRGVQSRVRAASRAAVLRQLRRDLGYARRRPPGSADAIQLVLNAAVADAARFDAAAERFERLGDTLDATGWAAPTALQRGERERTLRGAGARTLTPELAARLHVGALAAAPERDADALGGRRFWDALAGRDVRAPAARRLRENGSYARSVDRMLTLAALLIVNASAGERSRVNDVIDDEAVRQCLALQQLQFRQCASVSAFANEDAFCLARHGLSGPGGCFSAIAR